MHQIEMLPSNPYTAMQRGFYDREGVTGNMNRENHRHHTTNPDYWTILVGETEDPSYKEKTGLDFGCGCGRNVQNLIGRFKRMDGVDISPVLVEQARANILRDGHSTESFQLYTCDGVSLNGIPDDEYDFLMSTIVLQHIAVYQIRYNYMKEFLRVLKPGGRLSFQMGFGRRVGSTPYYENNYSSTTTNGGNDVSVTDPSQLTKDLADIGFTEVEFVIREPFDDHHEKWIFVKAKKPTS
jgi:SAM-dependent methyltransferase